MTFGLTGQGKAASGITPLAITGISPSTGSTAGGTAVTITGRGFELGMTAKIDGVLCTSLVVTSANTLTCVTPACATTGLKAVRLDRITTAANVSSNAFTYEFTDPTTIANLTAWYRADRDLTLTGTTAAWIPTRNDTAISPLPTLAAIATLPPALSAADAGYNGQDVVAWNSTDNGVALGGLTTTSTALTMFFVGEPGSGASNRFAFGGADLGGTLVVYVESGTENIRMLRGSNFDSGSTWSGKQAVACVFDGASSKVYKSALTAVATGTTTTINGLASVCLGADNAGTANHWRGADTGKIAEVLIYNRALTNSEIGLVLGYLGTRYTITIGA